MSESRCWSGSTSKNVWRRWSQQLSQLLPNNCANHCTNVPSWPAVPCCRQRCKYNGAVSILSPRCYMRASGWRSDKVRLHHTHLQATIATLAQGQSELLYLICKLEQDKTGRLRLPVINCVDIRKPARSTDHGVRWRSTVGENIAPSSKVHWDPRVAVIYLFI